MKLIKYLYHVLTIKDMCQMMEFILFTKIVSKVVIIKKIVMILFLLMILDFIDD